MPMLAIYPSTRSLQSTGTQVFRNSTHKQTDGHCDIETESAQRADSVKTQLKSGHCQNIERLGGGGGGGIILIQTFCQMFFLCWQYGIMR